MELFQNADFPLSIVPPQRVVVANPVIISVWSEDELKADNPEDISWSWYIIAEGPNSQYITIDFSEERLGWCYDSFWDVHPRDSQIIAKSFPDLLEHLLANQGRHWYWLQPEFKQLGSPYDGLP
jgi:antitoxin YokJ